METTTLDEVLAAKNVASTGDYILAQTSGGETVRISKADLATVVAGQQEKRMLTATDDFDNILDVGYYFCYHTDLPSHAPENWSGSGMLKVERYNKDGNSIHMQTIVSNTSNVYYRIKWASNDFGSWNIVTSTVKV